MSSTQNLIKCYQAFNSIHNTFNQILENPELDIQGREIFIESYEEDPYAALLDDLKNIETVLQAIASSDQTRLNQTLEQMKHLFYP